MNQYELPDWLWDYTKETIEQFDFDSSHDLKHFINVYNYTKRIVETDYPQGTLIKGITRHNSLEILYYAAFSHDLIDSKYVESKTAIEKLRNLYLSNGYYEKYLDIIIFLIDNMSYSKQRRGQIIPEKYQLIMNIISDADKLDAYRVERVIAYHENKNKQTLSERTNKGWIKTILVKRVLTYRDQWLKTNYAKKISLKLHEQVQLYVDNNLSNIEMYDY